MLRRLSGYSFCSFWEHTSPRKSFKVLQQSDIAFFKNVLPHHSVITDEDTIAPHNICFRKLDKGHSKLVLFPSTAVQISKILSYCNDQNIAVVPQGGNTGLVGGSVPLYDQLILNLAHLNKVHSFSAITSVLNCQAGCILQNLNNYLSPYGFEVPLDLGAKGSCQIGGNAATNAGGKYVLKYGSFRSHILGMEVVLANGKILDLKSQIRKDNTGYDLKQLFIGSQGTLGIITELNIHCQKTTPNNRIMAFKTNKFQTILQSLPKLKEVLGKSLNALEYVDGYTYHTVTRHLHPSIFDKVSEDQHVLFIQVSADDQVVEKMLEQMGHQYNQSVISNNDKEYQKIWKIREDVAVAAVREPGKILAYDISFDVREWPKLLHALRQKTKTLVMGYGHIGDGNLHVNICLPQGKTFHDNFIFKEVTARKGSISAQHGVGLHKGRYLHLQKDEQNLLICKGIKQMLDPKGILNPYKVIPQ